MHVYSHHIGDFNTATLHLSRLERSIYRDALEYYYVTESPLDGSDFGLLARRLRCETEDEKEALRFVLAEFFDIDESGACYIQPRCERELLVYRVNVEASGVVKANVNKRQQVHREQRKAMYAALRAQGVTLAWNASISEVRAAFNEHCKGHDLSRTCHAPVTANHSPFPIPLNQEIPPNPPAGGEGAAIAAQSAMPASQPAEQQGASAGGGVDVQALAARLMACFPMQRRIRVTEVEATLQQLLETGAVEAQQLLAAAMAQAPLLSKDDGKACPSVLRWLRESRWRDASLSVTGGVTGAVSGGVTGAVTCDVTGVAAVPANWRETRSGIELVGSQLGLGAWDEEKDRLFASYEARVVKAYGAEVGGGAA